MENLEGEVKSMKRMLLTTLLLVPLLALAPVETAGACQVPEPGLKLYQEMLVTSLDAQLNIIIQDYYGESVQYDLQDVKILDVKRHDAHSFDIKLEVEVFNSSQVKLGVEQITFHLEPGMVELLNYHHLKSYPKP